MALLGKWNWRFLTEPDSLWCRVVKANCNTCGESSWWKEVQLTRFEEGWSWFEHNLQKTVFEGNETQFWTENWLGSGCLELRFHRLYNLSCQKRVSVKDMGVWENGVWRWMFRWRRRLQGREVGWLEELLAVLGSAQLVEDKRDRWLWTLEGGGSFSVNSSYVFLQGQSLDEPDPVYSWIWTAPAPSNMKAFAWRVMLGRIQTRDNLFKRCVLNTAAEVLCPLCGLEEETCSHLLFSCRYALQIWYECYDWLGISTAQIPLPEVHLLQFAFIGGSRRQKLGEITIWLAIIWTMWGLRNRVIFKGGEVDTAQMLEQIQLKSWQWLTARLVDFSYSWFEWKMNPGMCLLSL